MMECAKRFAKGNIFSQPKTEVVISVHLVTIETDGVAKVSASESGGGCQGDGAAPIPCIFYFGKFFLSSLLF